MSNSILRILTAVIAAPVALGLAYIGGGAFVVLIAVIGIVGQVELYRMARTTGVEPNLTGGVVLGGLVVASLAWPVLWPLAAFWLVMFIVLAPFLLPQDHFLGSLTGTLAGALYPTGLLGSLVLLRSAEPSAQGVETGFWLVVLVFLLVWATDIFAYYVGKWIGQRSLAPSISPNKTWEGTAGGLLAAGLVAVAVKTTVLTDLTWLHLLMLTLIGGGLSQIGDLMESQLKRSTGADDSSSLLPGHGGVLDRFDGMVVAAPLIYLYLDVVVGLF